ncbi:MAG TPA: hypothetical protein VKB02_14915 [Pyrinomonadaceae bacterium]|nr:hypothetical protein [Pyrinomonadaceae bacterium]
MKKLSQMTYTTALLTAENDYAAGVHPSGHNIIPQNMGRTVTCVLRQVVLEALLKFSQTFRWARARFRS